MASTLNSTTTSSSPNHTTTTNSNEQLQQMLCRAAFLNGLGVAVLMQNEHQPHLDNNPVYNTACLQSFQQALALMGQAAASCWNLDYRTHGGGGGGGGAPVVWKSFCLPKLKDDRFFVCAQALVFNVPTNKPVITQADISFYCAIVLHNMALTHHRLAILGTTGGGCGIQRDDQQGHESNIQQAEQLYEHTYRVLTTIVNSHSPGDDIDMLKAVTLNNLAQIYYMTYRFKESDDLLWEIRKLCPALWRSSSMGANNINDGASSASSSSPMFHQIIQEIVINVFFVAGHPSVAPSA